MGFVRVITEGAARFIRVGFVENPEGVLPLEQDQLLQSDTVLYAGGYLPEA